jgi:arylsulfatase A
MATLAALVHYELPDECAEDSHDFLPYLSGQVDLGPRRLLVHNTKPDQYALRDGDWLLIHAKSGYSSHRAPDGWKAKHRQPVDDDLPVELYHLKDDIGQRYNLATQHPQRAESMQSLLKRIRDQGYSAPRLSQH